MKASSFLAYFVVSVAVGTASDLLYRDEILWGINVTLAVPVALLAAYLESLGRP